MQKAKEWARGVALEAFPVDGGHGAGCGGTALALRFLVAAAIVFVMSLNFH